jgi:4-diphosphocytidyl-2-C-methyl-D-erythritol kinase
VVIFPNSKINLGLHVIRKRKDGFHDLETVFYPVPLCDALEIIHVPAIEEKTAITVTGLAIDNDPAENISLKAYYLLKKDFDLPVVKIHLHKVIPVGAGLGGGSANGAFTLLLLNKKFNLKISEERLMAYALKLGSDCPFFIRNKVCYATQRGEVLQPIQLDLSSYKLVLVNPGIHINTGWAFSQIRPKENRTSLLEIIQQPVTNWKDNVVNDFEPAIFEQHPSIKQIKEKLYQNGAVYAAMSGSGSSVYGLFEKTATPVLDLPGNYFIKWFM